MLATENPDFDALVKRIQNGYIPTLKCILFKDYYEQTMDIPEEFQETHRLEEIDRYMKERMDDEESIQLEDDTSFESDQQVFQRFGDSPVQNRRFSLFEEETVVNESFIDEISSFLRRDVDLLPDQILNTSILDEM